MFELIRLDRQKKNYKQISLTLDQGVFEDIAKIAATKEMSVHGFVKSVLISYINYIKSKN
jgi:hypothetical protein